MSPGGERAPCSHPFPQSHLDVREWVGPRLQTGSSPQPWPFLFSGQIWRTEDMKTSVPGLATPEEPSAPPPSPRGTCPAGGGGTLALLTLSSPLPSRAPFRPTEPREGGQSTVYCKPLVGCEALWRSPVASWPHHAGTSELWAAPWTCEQW